MTEIPDAWVQTFNEAYWQIRAEGGRLTPIPTRIAAALAAVRPLIEAEVRADEQNRIADAIHAYWNNSEFGGPDYFDGLDAAARVARGETP